MGQGGKRWQKVAKVGLLRPPVGQGSAERSTSRLLSFPGVRSITSSIHSRGSTPIALQLLTKEYTIAARTAASRFPQNRKFFLPKARGPTAFSTRLLSMQKRPSFTYRPSLGINGNVYLMAFPIRLCSDDFLAVSYIHFSNSRFSFKHSIREPIDLLNNAIPTSCCSIALSASCILTLNSPMIKKGTYTRLILADMD